VAGRGDKPSPTDGVAHGAARSRACVAGAAGTTTGHSSLEKCPVIVFRFF
jgi:hypothetical protein